MRDLVQSLGLLLMLAGALLVIAGVIGLAISRKKAAENDDEPVSEPSPEPPPQMPPPPRFRGSRGAAGRQPDLPE